MSENKKDEDLKIFLSLDDQARIISSLKMKAKIYEDIWRSEIKEKYKVLIKKLEESASDTFHLRLTNQISQNQKPKKEFRKLVSNGKKNKNEQWWKKL